MEKTEFSIQIDTAEQKKMSEEPMKQEEAVSKVHEELEKQEPLIELRNIYKIYYMGDEEVHANDGISLSINKGEFVAIVGKSGSGKSTLMKILSGVYTRDEGTMEIFGKSYDDLTPKQAQEAGVAIIHQELNMCRHLTVTENMFLGREVKGGLSLNNAKMRKEAKKVLDDLRIDISPDQIVGDLPVSKQQMVEIAKALSINARILIMDEPTRGIDVVLQTKDYIYVMELKLDGSADEALRQIEEKGYALPFAKDSRKLYKIGVNFSSEIRGIVEWKIVEDNS